jgi:hypothetical protein
MVKTRPVLFVSLIIVITAEMAAAAVILLSSISDWLILLSLAPISAAFASLLFAKRLANYTQAGQLIQVLVTSFIVVICAHLVFGFILALIPQMRGDPDPGFMTMALGYTLIEIMYGGIITIPFGLVAGYILYLLMKRGTGTNDARIEA